jgi:predicted metalloendopeptidase
VKQVMMKLAFLPGDLHLTQADDSFYQVTVHGQEIFRTRSKRVAVQKFNEIRQQMEKKFPPSEFSPEERAEILSKAIADSVVAQVSLPTKKKKTTAGSTRTFGG